MENGEYNYIITIQAGRNPGESSHLVTSRGRVTVTRNTRERVVDQLLSAVIEVARQQGFEGPDKSVAIIFLEIELN